MPTDDDIQTYCNSEMNTLIKKKSRSIGELIEEEKKMDIKKKKIIEKNAYFWYLESIWQYVSYTVESGC